MLIQTKKIGIMCLTVNGKVFRWGPDFDSSNQKFQNPTRIAQKFGVILDLKCGFRAGAVKLQKDFEWYTWTKITQTPQYYVGLSNFKSFFFFDRN